MAVTSFLLVIETVYTRMDKYAIDDTPDTLGNLFCI